MSAPAWWLGPLYEVHPCSECGRMLLRVWDDDDYGCPACGVVF